MSDRAPSTGKPNFIMVGIDRPGGVRLYASREIPEHALAWGLAQNHYTATGWHIDAEMRQVLIIDKPTWGEAFARAFEIWANQDREKALSQPVHITDEIALHRRKALRGGE